MHTKYINRRAASASKLTAYCDGILEAAWLAAVIVTPVFYNIYSSRIFEPDKATLLRSLALVILAAWLVKPVTQPGLAKIRESTLGGRPLSNWKDWVRFPLLGPVAAYFLVYLIATLFSVSPRISFWGSYQRLQGTYTALAYLAVFAALVFNLRRREQVGRLVGVIILASLPVSLYGVLQRFQIDPVPWGGDVSQRIAANMGNSIFVGAYFILAFPLTLLRIVESFEALLKDQGLASFNFVRATAYVFIAILQVIALYFTGSRGPWLGWGASLVFIWLGLSLIWRKRGLLIAGVSMALAGAVFLVLLNLPGGPLAELRTAPALGRLGQLLDSESRTGRVRSLIWQGAAELVWPHAPLEYPDGKKDALNFVRPLIGYGPESMYVAYNRFYPPELTQVEKRNATPDRSHNETWDSLVTNGLLGLVTYLLLFGSVIYYGLKWLHLVNDSRQRNLFLALFLAGGGISSVIFVAWKGWGYLGVALPFGMILGVILYLIWTALTGRYPAPESPLERLRAYLLLALLSAIVAHFVEINFGIAIVATRTYFWTYTGLLLLVGVILPAEGQYGAHLQEGASQPVSGGPEASDDETPQTGNPAPARAQERRPVQERGSAAGKAKKHRTSRLEPSLVASPLPAWLRLGLLNGVLLAIVLMTLGYDFITNASRASSAGQVLWTSLTTIQKGQTASLGILALLLVTWVTGFLLLVAEEAGNIPEVGESRESPRNSRHRQVTSDSLRLMGVVAAVSVGLALIFLLFHSGNLASLVRNAASTAEAVMDQVKQSEGILATYYVFLFALVFLGAFWLPDSWPGGGNSKAGAGVFLLPGSLLVAFLLGSLTNLRVIQADIAFKSADLFARGDTWPLAIRIYNRANDLAPNEDYYYLFLGRAYLEYARTLSDTVQRDQLISRAAQDLLAAQKLNPLNTDHTANLARLHSLWATFTQDPVIQAERAEISDNYFSRALVLSPNNARLWDEWAALYLNVTQESVKALALLERAAELDPYYDWTFGLLGDYYARFLAVQADLSQAEREAAVQKAIESYQKAVDLAAATNSSLAYNYAVSLASVHLQVDDTWGAIQAYEQSLEFLRTISSGVPADAWRVELVLARLYVQLGDTARAGQYAASALAQAPDDQKPGVQAVITQLGLQP